jgi:signal transduction histidine kinase
MLPRRPLFLLTCAALASGAFYLVAEHRPTERFTKSVKALQANTDRVSKQLQQEAEAACALFALAGNTPLTDALVASIPTGSRIYKNGVVVAWTDHAPVDDTVLDTARADHLVLPDGVYLHAVAWQGQVTAHVLKRIWFDPPIRNAYLQPHFEAVLNPPAGLLAGKGPGEQAALRDAAGVLMFNVYWPDGEAPPGARAHLRLFLLLVALSLCVLAAWELFMVVRPEWLGFVGFAAVLALVRWAVMACGQVTPLVDPKLFDPSLFASSVITPSLGDLLINASFLLFVSLFARRMILPKTRRTAWTNTLFLTLAVFALAWEVDQVLVGLVRDSNINLDLFHVQRMDAYSWAALGSIALLLLGWCALADALLPNLRRVLPRWRGAWLVVPVALAAAVLHGLTGKEDLIWSLWPLPALVLVARLPRGGLIGAFSLIALFALLTAQVLDVQTLERSRRDREAVAETTAPREDPVIELLFGEASKGLEASRTVAQWVRQGNACSAADLDRLVRQPFFTGYWDRFDLRLHLISAAGRFYCSTSPDAASSARSIVDRYEQAVPTTGNADLRLAEKPGEEALYLGRIPLPGGLLVAEIRPRVVADGLGFPELLLAGDRGHARSPMPYSRARYERGILTESNGEAPFPVTWGRHDPDGSIRWEKGGFEYFAQGTLASSLVVVAAQTPTGLDHVTAFSFLFLFYCLVAAIAGLAFWGFTRPRPPLAFGVRGKVRIGVLTFAIASLALFTLGMRNLLDERSEQRSSKAVDERTRGVLAELRQTLRGEDVLTPAIAPYLDHLLSNLSNVFFTDLSLYGTDGLLLATSREQVFNTGLLDRRMDPEAYRRLAFASQSAFMQDEQIGTASYSTAYAPFRNDRGTVLAYLAMPYFARQSELEQEKAAGFAALVNLFALLFLLSALAAALITAWTTRPLDLLRKGLERIGLGARNVPIAYAGNDELGQLVQVYNTKVEELRRSAERLARSERESAWREMAQQVAHEIKNPLTPMKLAIQHFQRTWTPDAPDAKPRLEKLTAGLVEQIDTLGRIAGEFSDFAQMPPAHPQRLNLRAIAATAVSLFAGNTGTVQLKEGPEVIVNADKEHLLRVLNNLIKNAHQAVPDEVLPRIEVSVSSRDGMAVLEVCDNGSGIPADVSDKIFTPNFTTKSSGMGLGLAMVKRMVEQAGGNVRFETSTESGKTGTSFFVELPLLP